LEPFAEKKKKGPAPRGLVKGSGRGVGLKGPNKKNRRWKKPFLGGGLEGKKRKGSRSIRGKRIVPTKNPGKGRPNPGRDGRDSGLVGRGKKTRIRLRRPQSIEGQR